MRKQQRRLLCRRFYVTKHRRLQERRKLTDKLVEEIISNNCYATFIDFNLRSEHMFNVNFRTQRHKTSFIVSDSFKTKCNLHIEYRKMKTYCIVRPIVMQVC